MVVNIVIKSQILHSFTLRHTFSFKRLPNLTIGTPLHCDVLIVSSLFTICQHKFLFIIITCYCAYTCCSVYLVVFHGQLIVAALDIKCQSDTVHYRRTFDTRVLPACVNWLPVGLYLGRGSQSWPCFCHYISVIFVLKISYATARRVMLPIRTARYKVSLGLNAKVSGMQIYNWPWPFIIYWIVIAV